MTEETVLLSQVVVSQSSQSPQEIPRLTRDIECQDAQSFLSHVQDGMWALMEAQRVYLLESQVHWKTLEDRRMVLEAALVQLQQGSDTGKSLSVSNGETNGQINGEITNVENAEGATGLTSEEAMGFPSGDLSLIALSPADQITAGNDDSIEDCAAEGCGAPAAGAGSDKGSTEVVLDGTAASNFRFHKKKSLLGIAINQAAAVGGLDRSDSVKSHSDADAELPRWRRILKSPKFDLWVGVIIVFNCVVMSLQLEYNGQQINPACGGICEDSKSDFAEKSFAVIEQVFTALFALELLMRLAASGIGYLKTFLNAMDGIIVGVSVIDSWVLTPLGSEGVSNVAILRLVRLVRLSKVLRVVRVMKAFKSLRVLVSAVAASVGALAWSMTLLFILELSGAIFLAQILRPYMEDPERDMKEREFLWMRFGTWVRSMLSIFEITMAPGGFINYRVISDQVHPAFGIFFAIYVCIVTFAVVRVITALFLKTTLSASDQDEAQLAADRARQQEAYARILHSSVAAAHGHYAETNWRMDKSDLEDIMATPQMDEWMRDVELPPSEADRLFDALDQGDGLVSFNDFVTALMRMRGPPRAADAVVTRAETHKILGRLRKIEDTLFPPLMQYGAAFGSATTSVAQTTGEQRETADRSKMAL